MTGARPGIRESLVHGWRAVHLTSDTLEVTVLPDKGADIYAITDLGSGIDPLFKAPVGTSAAGLRRPGPAATARHSWRITKVAGRSFSRTPMTRQATAA